MICSARVWTASNHKTEKFPCKSHGSEACHAYGYPTRREIEAISIHLRFKAQALGFQQGRANWAARQRLHSMGDGCPIP